MKLINLKKTRESKKSIWYKTIRPNAKGEIMEIEISFVENDNKYCILNLWYKEKYIPKKLKNYISLETYVTDKNGDCWGKYNPTVIDGTNKINFDYVLEVNENNINYLLNKCLELGEFKIEEE